MSALFRLDPVQSRCGTSRAPLHEPPRRAGAKKKGRHEASLVLAPSALATLVFLRCARSESEAPAEPLVPIGATVSIEPTLGLPRVPIVAAISGGGAIGSLLLGQGADFPANRSGSRLAWIVTRLSSRASG